MDNQVIKIEIESNETIMELVKRMLDIKKERGQDVECFVRGGLVTTEGCKTLKQAVVKNAVAVFEEYETDRADLLATSYMQNEIQKFKNRGKKYKKDTDESRKIAGEIDKKQKEYDKLIEELDKKESPREILDWLISTIPYINDKDLYLPLGLENTEYKTQANYIVSKMQEKGYELDSISVSNVDDYYKKIISYLLLDLKQYGFFAYEYADNLRDQNIELNDSLTTTFRKMIAEKKELQEEVIITMDGVEYSTEGCNDIIQLYIKYKEKFLEEYQKEFEITLKNPQIQEAINEFNKENVQQHMIELAEQAEKEEYKKLDAECTKLQNLIFDYNNPEHVYDWLKYLEDYINIPCINFVPVEEDSFVYRSDDILLKLKQYGYGEISTEIHTKEDFYRTAIGYQMQELEKYNFFVSSYLEKKKEFVKASKVAVALDRNNKKMVMPMPTMDTNVFMDDAQIKLELTELQMKKNQANITAIEAYRLGMTDDKGKNTTTEKFSDRKQKIQEKIETLQTKLGAPVPDLTNENISEGINFENYMSEFEAQLNELDLRKPENKELFENYQKAIFNYNQAKMLIENATILPVYEAALLLPKDDEFRKKLMETTKLLDLSARGDPELAEGTIKQANQKIDDLMAGTKLSEEERNLVTQYRALESNIEGEKLEEFLDSVIALPKTSAIQEPLYDLIQYKKKEISMAGYDIVDEIEKLNKEYQEIEKEEAIRIQKTQNLLLKLQAERTELQEKYASLTTPLEEIQEESKEDSDKDDDHHMGGGSGSSPLPEPTTEIEENDQYIKKLQSVGQVSVDLERRLDSENSWMELNTAQSLNKLTEEKEEVVDSQPHMITQIEKASQNLIEKIRSIDFKTKITQVVEYMKNMKRAVVTAGSLIGAAMIGSNLTQSVAEVVPTVEVENHVESQMNVGNEESSIPNMEEPIQQELDVLYFSPVDQSENGKTM